MNAKRLPILILLLGLLIFTSCSKTEENVPLTIETAQITVDKMVREASLVNQNIPFRILNEEGEDITSIVTFYVNGEPIEGNSFSSSTIGEFEVYGVYIEDGVEITTNIEPFRVIIPKQKIVVEDYTGTWCGFCPRVAGAIQSLELETHDIVVVAVHETAISFPDPMHFDQVQLLKDAFDVEGLPAARINRNVDWPTPHLNSAVTSIAGLDTNLALAINSELTGSELNVQVNVVFEEGSIDGDKLVVYLIEDGIINDQINYYNGDNTSPFYNLGDPIPDFIHNDVLRNSLTDLLGDTIPNTEALVEYIASFSIEVPSDYDTNNLSIAAMVVDENNNAKNAQVAEISEDKPYE